MFTHLILLKRSPWFIYSPSEADALETASKFAQHDLVGVVVSKGLEVKRPIQKVVLEAIEQKLINDYSEVQNLDDVSKELDEALGAPDEPAQ
jgi:hypothetical protein